MGKKILFIMVGAAVVVGFKMKNAGNDSGDIKAEMNQVVVSLPCYANNEDYIDTLFERNHDMAFRAAYDMGSRRRGSTFDEVEYIKDLFSRMIKTASQAQKTELVTCFQQTRDILVADE